MPLNSAVSYEGYNTASHAGLRSRSSGRTYASPIPRPAAPKQWNFTDEPFNPASQNIETFQREQTSTGGSDDRPATARLVQKILEIPKIGLSFSERMSEVNRT